MNSQQANNINVKNVENIRYQIHQKKNPYPFYATYNDGSSVLTDMDNFPYNRYFRGVPENYKPIVFEREAGWRPIYNTCYNVEEPIKHEENKRKICFQTACSTVYPCYPDYASKYSDRDFFNVSNNNACISEYR